MTRIVILGAGTGGTLTANRLRDLSGDDAEIVVVDRDDRHIYQPGLLFVPFGLAHPEGIVRSRSAQLHDGIEFRLAEVGLLKASFVPAQADPPVAQPHSVSQDADPRTRPRGQPAAQDSRGRGDQA